VVRVHRATTALAAIADGVETLKHGILEKGVMHMSALVFGFQNPNRFVAGDEA
jgi:hypothetical protein